MCNGKDSMAKCKIVMIDSGVSGVHKKICRDNIVGIGLKRVENGYTFTDDISDWADHGTGIYGILKDHNDDAELFVFKISRCVNEVNDLDELVYILEFIYNNIVCNLINISMSVSYCDNLGLIEKLENICDKLLQKGILIISAFDNLGGLSYPAIFDGVIGVSSGEGCLEKNDIEFVENNMVNVCGKGGIQSVISSSGHTIMREGNSLACAHITGIISKFYKPGMSRRQVLDELQKRASTTHYVPHKDIKKMELPIKNKKAAVVTFGKEMHSVIRFSFLLQCKIVKVYDVKQAGLVGKSVNNELHIHDVLFSQDYTIENIQNAEFNLFDMVIIGHISKLVMFKEIKNTIKNFLDQCITLNKYIYSLDDLMNYFNNYTTKNYFMPKITKEDSIYPPLDKLHYISKPAVGVFGTSSVQGKFTLQLNLRKNLIEMGYLVGQIGSEPTALLFGMDYCFPFGYNSGVHIARYDTISYLNKCLFNICSKDVDLIIVGCQSRTIQEYNYNLINYPLQQIEFLLATQPDVVILCVNPWDTDEYILRTISCIESLVNSKVIAIAMSPITRILKENNCYQHISLTTNESENISKKIVKITGKKMYNISDAEDMKLLSEFLIFSLSE